MELFRGQLVQDGLGFYIVPRLWEWDGLSGLFTDPIAAEHAQVLKMATMRFTPLLQSAIKKSTLNGGYVPVSFGPVFPTASPWYNVSTLITGNTWLFQPGPLDIAKRPVCIDFCQERPIGIHDAANGQIAFDDNVIPLSYDLAEGLASGSIQFNGFGVGEFPMIINDDNKYGGIYTLTFRVERCVSMTQCSAPAERPTGR